jgi:pyruvate formate lyase activating enzyme
MAEFIANTLGANVPWHVSRFHGDYQKLDTPSTPIETLTLACRLGREAGLKHIYCGNVPGQTDERTYCPGCGEVLIDRQGFSVGAIRLKDGACPACGQAIAGVWD